jgi:hypothetical protein
MAEFSMNVPAQGIVRDFTQDEAIKFIKAEQDWYTKHQSLSSEAVVLNNRNFGDPNLYRTAISKLREVAVSVERGDEHAFASYSDTAQNLGCVIGQGFVGRNVDRLTAASDPVSAKWLLLIHSRAWIENASLNNELAPLRALASGSPSAQEGIDLVTASEAMQRASEAQKTSQAASQELSSFIVEKSNLLSELEDRYRKKLLLEGPANLWSNVVSTKRRGWILWLLIFTTLVLAPLAFFAFNWDFIVKVISQASTTSSGAISLSGIAAITVPALFYAWLLKNVSRIFLSNLALADDAAHRRALAVTYLGLAENPKISISPEERAIILNALFRPVPPHSGDEGPPAGLIDLVKRSA